MTSKICEWLDNRLYNNIYNLPDIKELIDVISKYYRHVPTNGFGTYKDMTPDELWERMCSILGVTPGNIDAIELEMEGMLDKMCKSSYAHEHFKSINI